MVQVIMDDQKKAVSRAFLHVAQLHGGAHGHLNTSSRTLFQAFLIAAEKGLEDVHT